MTTKKWLAALVVAVLALIVVGAVSGGSQGAPQSSTASLSTVSSSTPLRITASTQVAQSSTTSTGPAESSTSSISSTSSTPTVLVTSSGSLQVHFIDVGQGDSILILAPDGTVILIDGGEAGSGALAYLEDKGIKRVNLMIATHPHADHIGGLVDVLQSLQVDEVVTNGELTTTRTYERFLDAIAGAKAVYTEAKRGDKLAVGSLSFDVLSPAGPGGEDLNQGSLVLRLLYGNVAFLFTGDTGREAEAGMLGVGETFEAQILKVGHHGSYSASSPSFLSAVGPQVAIYSCSLGNSYGHPHVETIAALVEEGAQVYGTDQNGTVVVTSDGTAYQVRTEEGQPRAPPAVTPTFLVPAGSLAIEVVSLTSPISHGSTAKLTIKTIPGSRCTITVYYKSGASEAAGLGDQTASSSGTVTWHWKVGARTTPGVWDIVVTAEAGGEEESIDIPFEVR